TRDVPGHAAQAVQGREHRQAGVESRGGLTMKTITVTRTIPAPIDKVFDLLADHANYKTNFGVKDSKLIKEGKPDKNGLGAVRYIDAGPIQFEEEITAWERPKRYDYL